MDIVLKYFPDLTEQQKEQYHQLLELYSYWNERINVISRKDVDQLYERHVLHSLSIAQFIQFKPESQILDIGTGGGFPGIPLAIMFPNTQFTLVDSIGKKIKVVNEVSAALGLKNVSGYHDRAEKIKGTYDFVVSRAVARTRQLFLWTHQKIATNHLHSIDNGYLLLKGGDLHEELKEYGKSYQELSLQDYFEEPFFKTKKLIYLNR